MIGTGNCQEILYLTYDGLTDPLGQAQILPYLSGLALRGHRISIVSFEKSGNEHVRSDVNRLCIRHGLEWHPLVYHKSPPVLSTVFDLWVARRLASSLVRKRDIRIVHCRSYLTAIVGLWLKKKYQTGFIFDMRGFWIEERVEGGLWKLKNPMSTVMYRYFKRKELHFFENADHIVCLTNKAANIVAQSSAAGPITVIPCCVEGRLFDPKKIDQQRQADLVDKLGLKQKFVILYLGSVGTWYMLDEMLDFFKVVQRKIVNAKFLIVSNDPQSTVSKMVKATDIAPENVIVLRSRRSDVPLFLSLANFSLFFIKPTFSKQGSSPTKLAESLAMGVPVVANAGIGDLDQLFSENNFGLLVHKFTESEYEKTIDSMMRYEKQGDLSTVAGRAFSLESGIASYEAVYRSLFGSEMNIPTKFDQ